MRQIGLIILAIASIGHIIYIEKEPSYVQNIVILYFLAIVVSIVAVRKISSYLYRGIAVALIIAMCYSKFKLEWSTLLLATLVLMY